MTCGARSSEFLVCILALFIGAGLALFGIEGGVIASVLSVAIAYIGGRSAVKFKGETK